ncbi:hypothetical protein [Aureibacillus halotolerans]|uniref:Uncharacterized protein n=1 Tax=Aureibacillus halotolerans TaxID=1508390 RepID=A0A4R6TQ53_9BACI|nr:hypothetical protein [Aureibacillus halotolerans]TDQ34629.1 hypothetical protein EV213_12447 [Aureibacillus halotolerans]
MTIPVQAFFPFWISCFSVIMAAIALISLIAGKYPPRIVWKNTLKTFAAVFILFTGIHALHTYSDHYSQWQAIKKMERHFTEFDEARNNLSEMQHLFAQVSSFSDDYHFDHFVYVGNFNETFDFEGQLKVTMYDNKDEILEVQIFDVKIDAGAKFYLDQFSTPTKAASFQWEWRTPGKPWIGK